MIALSLDSFAPGFAVRGSGAATAPIYLVGSDREGIDEEWIGELDALGQPDDFSRLALSSLFAVEALDAALGRLRLALRGNHGVEIKRQTVDNAVAFLTLLPTAALNVDVSIDADGEVSFDWLEARRRTLSVSIGSASLGYSAIVGQESAYGRVPFADEIPRKVAVLLSQVLRSPA